MTDIDSRQVSWWSTHVFVSALLTQAGDVPAAGTPSWCALDDADPRKLLALAGAGEHHVLRLETAQERQAEIAREISAAGTETGEWRALNRIVQGGSPSRIPRQVTR